ncbi:hypothetical protein AN926_07770 [Thermus scotoductus]|uniref:Uncharacterized protein n=1 Tax=Thermus scotoductus TaxID=37636 RepID=A0A0N0ZPN5_THESC|nr:hypothetical protein AN926_07770 [Thermus scotoductus]
MKEGPRAWVYIAQVLQDHLHGQPGRHFSCAMPPHPIRHHEDPTPGGEGVAHGVLVFGPLEAGVGFQGEGQAGHGGILPPFARGQQEVAALC